MFDSLVACIDRASTEVCHTTRLAKSVDGFTKDACKTVERFFVQKFTFILLTFVFGFCRHATYHRKEHVEKYWFMISDDSNRTAVRYILQVSFEVVRNVDYELFCFDQAVSKWENCFTELGRQFNVRRNKKRWVSK